MLISIDPGVKRNAYAVFASGVLHQVGWIAPELVPGTDVIVENPVLYGGRAARGSGKDLLDLARAVGAIEFWAGANHASVQLVAPARWKGQVCKPICHARIWRELSAGERVECSESFGMHPLDIEKKITDACKSYAKTRKVTRYSWAAHNLLDAIGIGLWALKRQK